MQAERRQQLRAAQIALARALSGSSPLPPGFAREYLALAAESLRDKRLRSAARAWPALRHRLGKDFAPLFAEYASRTPVQASAAEDVKGFARFLAEKGRLPNGFGAWNIRKSLHRWLNREPH